MKNLFNPQMLSDLPTDKYFFNTVKTRMGSIEINFMANMLPLSKKKKKTKGK